MTPPPQRIGPFEIVRELARGGMGVVYVARHVELGRTVALKQTLGAGAEGADGRRFELEAEALGRLKHRNIVEIHEVGVSPLGPYFAMDLIEGRSLKQLLADGPVDPRQAARWAADLARALEHAHTLGILHRDLKPANVLVEAASGRPMLTDFGLAKDMHAERERLTRTGQTLGTPAYMSPEQADGDSAAIGPATDVYGLGATLYHLLKGAAPFDGATAMNIVAKVLQRDAPPIRTSRPECDVDLETIALKCLEKDPARRYPSASALGDDLERYLAGEPIEGKPARHALRWIRTHKASAVGVAICVLILVAGGVWGEAQRRSWAEHREHVERMASAKKALDAQATSGANLAALSSAIVAARATLVELPESVPADERVSLQSSLEGAAIVAIDAASKGSDVAALNRAFEDAQKSVKAIASRSTRLERRLARSATVRERMGTNLLEAIRTAATGRVEATNGWLSRFPGHPSTGDALRLRISEPIEERTVPGTQGRFLANGRRLLTYVAKAEFDRNARHEVKSRMGATVRLWDTQGPTLIHEPWTARDDTWRAVPIPTPMSAASNRARDRVAFWLHDGTLRWFAVAAPKDLVMLDGLKARDTLFPPQLALDAAGERLLIAFPGTRESPTRVGIWNRAGEKIHTLDIDSYRTSTRVAFEPGNKAVLVALSLNERAIHQMTPATVLRWVPGSNEEPITSQRMTSAPSAFSPDRSGAMLAYADGYDMVHILELPTLTRRVYPNGAELSPPLDAQFLTGEAPRSRGARTVDVAFSPDGRLLYALRIAPPPAKGQPAPPLEMRVFDTETGARLHAEPVPAGLRHLELSDDGDRLFLYGHGRLQVRYAWRR